MREADAERAAIVAWLVGIENGDDTDTYDIDTVYKLRLRIEMGEHSNA